MGTPKFNQDQFDFIIKHIEEGNSLRSALRQPNTPGSETFYKWIDDNEELAKRYARATEKRADAIFEDILEIADKQDQDVTVDDEGKEVINHNIVQRSRLQIDARKWALSKMNPKKYSDNSKLDLTTNGESLNIVSLGSGIKPDELTS
jgi:hypothetical protein